MAKNPMTTCKSCGGSGHVMRKACKKSPMDMDSMSDCDADDDCGPSNAIHDVCPTCGGTGMAGGAQ